MPALEDLQNLKQQMFKQKRAEAVQNANTAQQENSDALTRRFAAMGAQGSGASVAAQLKSKDMGEAQKNQAIQGLNDQEIASQQQDYAMKANQEEAQKSRDFSSAEAEKGRLFQGDLAARDLAQKNKIFDFESSTKLKELDLAQQQFELDKSTTEFNKRMAELSQNSDSKKGGLVEDITAGVKPLLTGSGPLGTPKNASELLVQGALGPVSVLAQPVNDLVKKFLPKWK